MATRMLQRRGTAAEWTAANPILGDGEIGFTTDTHVFKVGDGVTAWNSLIADVLTRTMVGAAGDLIIGTAADVVARLPRGTTGQRLSVKADGLLEWVNPYAIIDAAEDLIVGSGADAVKRLAKGTIGHRLSVLANGTVGWEALPAATNPFTAVDAVGDLLVGSAADTVARLAKGANGTVLTVNSSGVVVWAAPTSSSPTLVKPTTAYSVAAGVGYVLASGTFTVTLPAASANSTREIDVKNIGTGTITVASAGGTIDGAATAVIATQYHSITVVSDGTNWFII